MAIKTFTAGSVLTASDTNTFLANAGLVYVTSGTAAAAKPVNLNNLFNATYDNYRVILTRIAIPTAGNYTLQMRTGTTNNATNYYWSRIRNNQAGLVGDAQNGTTTIPLGSSDSQGNLTAIAMDIFDPFNAVDTKLIYSGAAYTGTRAEIYQVNAFHNVQTAFDGLSISTDVASISFNYTIYGYRKA